MGEVIAARTYPAAPHGGLLLAAVLQWGCTHEALDVPCPPVEAGDLVITELRGEQAGDSTDSYGQWIELLNARQDDIDLFGLHIELLAPDRADSVVILVRDQGLTVAGGEYVVIGRQSQTNLPAHVDYGYRINDATKGLYPAGVIEVSACDVLVDRVAYDALPSVGTLALDGALKASATVNDEPDAFCVDAAPAPAGPATNMGIPGSPGQDNPPCVP